ncbi:MAG: PGF-pre-PGF domain-containing protein [Candidatus Methanoperedens sp.]|nr:PGF-pre-PGF domain-containing protein [Candidatus Methanoperedens sp.]
MVENKGVKKRSVVASTLVTLIIVAMLIISGPAQAVSVSISGLQTAPYTQGSNVEFQVTINITDPDRFVPVTNISINVTGPSGINRTFAPDGTPLSGDPVISIDPFLIPHPSDFGYGYGYGYDSRLGSGHNFGYGYGYGYGYGAGGGSLTYIYNVTINTTSLQAGSYTAVASLNTGKAAKPSFSSPPADFTITTSQVSPVTVSMSVDPNRINPGSKGTIKVTIYNDIPPGFDVASINKSSVKFGRNGAGYKNYETPTGKLILHFNTEDTGIRCGDTQVTLIGKTTSGQDISGTANIETVGCGGGGGGGGSGGGGVVSSEPPENIDSYETKENDLRADYPVTFTFSGIGHWVSEIIITGRENENGIAVRIEALKGLSKHVNTPAPGTKYINILAGTKKIKEALIRFRVENSWIASEGILSSDDVRMYRWDGSKWDQLETRVLAKDSTYTYYETKTYAFSSLAISGLKAQVTASPTPGGGTPGGTPISGTPEATPGPVAPPTTLIAIVGMLVLIFIIVVFIKRKEIFKKKE